MAARHGELELYGDVALVCHGDGLEPAAGKRAARKLRRWPGRSASRTARVKFLQTPEISTRCGTNLGAALQVYAVLHTTVPDSALKQ